MVDRVMFDMQSEKSYTTEKCEKAKTEMLFLGHVMKEGTTKPDSDSIRSLMKTREPTLVEEAFRFFKASEYYRKFIPTFCFIAAPLHKYTPTVWSHQCQTTKSRFEPSKMVRVAFHQLREILTKHLVLRVFLIKANHSRYKRMLVETQSGQFYCNRSQMEIHHLSTCQRNLSKHKRTG